MTSTSNSFERCNQRELSLDFRPLGRNKSIECANHVNSTNNTNKSIECATSLLKGVLHKQRPPRRDPLGCNMGTSSNADDKRMSLLHHFHRRILLVHLDLPDEEEEGSALPLPKAQEPSRKTVCHIRCLRSDGGKEYFSDESISYLQGEGIRRERKNRHTPLLGTRPSMRKQEQHSI